MKKATSRCLLLLGLALPLIAAAAPSRYVFVWAMEAQHPHASTLALMSPDLTIAWPLCMVSTMKSPATTGTSHVR
ncbi:MAG TPA: hypothetical protein VMD06_09670 [Steroidobacteraceae bacterium]|nr:hypothetical protein [Steroidobacteraceae bacterium]